MLDVETLLATSRAGVKTSIDPMQDVASIRLHIRLVSTDSAPC